jgi:hypothetical protein
MLPTKFEAIQPLDPVRPLRALCLPPWVERCVAAVTFDGRLPSELALSQDQRGAISVRVDELMKEEMACDVPQTMVIIVGLVESLTNHKISAEQAEVRSEAWLTAFEGVPTWAVEEASVRWLQARAGPQNYAFPPTPPLLRQVADDILAEVRLQRMQLQQLLHAKPESQRDARVGRQLADLVAELRKKAAELGPVSVPGGHRGYLDPTLTE